MIISAEIPHVEPDFELFTVSDLELSAGSGVYRPKDSRNCIRVVVIKNGFDPAVIFEVGRNSIEHFDPKVWGGLYFVRTKENITIKFQ